MVSAIAQAQLQRIATVRKLIAQTVGDDPNAAQTIARFDERSKQALDAIEKLERTKVDVSKQRKDLAKERLARLKEQLRLLRMFGGSSKALARQAAALAREIASAVRSYAGSDGGATPIDDSGLAKDGGDAATDGNSDEAAATDAASADGATDDASAEATTNQDAAATPTVPADADDRAAALAQHGTDRDADRLFFQEAKNLLQQLRRIIEEAQRKDRVKQGKNAPQLADALNSIGSADRTVASVAQSALGAPVVAVAVPTPSVRISV